MRNINIAIIYQYVLIFIIKFIMLKSVFNSFIGSFSILKIQNKLSFIKIVIDNFIYHLTII